VCHGMDAVLDGAEHAFRAGAIRVKIKVFP